MDPMEASGAGAGTTGCGLEGLSRLTQLTQLVFEEGSGLGDALAARVAALGGLRSLSLVAASEYMMEVRRMRVHAWRGA